MELAMFPGMVESPTIWVAYVGTARTRVFAMLAREAIEDCNGPIACPIAIATALVSAALLASTSMLAIAPATAAAAANWATLGIAGNWAAITELAIVVLSASVTG